MSFLGSLIGAGGSSGAFDPGGETYVKGSERKSGDSRSEEGLELDDDAVQRIVNQVLGSADGLASIFAGEKSSGLYGSSVAAQEAGDFAATLVGEISRMRAKTVKTEEYDDLTESEMDTVKETPFGGLHKNITKLDPISGGLWNGGAKEKLTSGHQTNPWINPLGAIGKKLFKW